MNQRALAMTFDRADREFFGEHRDRRAHIRKVYQGECEMEFRTLGPHEYDRRRVLLCRADHRGNLLPEGKIMKIPFLAFADETIEDTDEVLLPIIHEIMVNAEKKYEG